MSASALPKKRRQRNMCWNIQKMWKNIPNIIDRNLKNDYQILIIFDKSRGLFLTQLAIKRLLRSWRSLPVGLKTREWNLAWSGKPHIYHLLSVSAPGVCLLLYKCSLIVNASAERLGYCCASRIIADGPSAGQLTYRWRRIVRSDRGKTKPVASQSVVCVPRSAATAPTARACIRGRLARWER